MFYIYKITNTTNNKVYIGLTTIDVDTRWKNHIRASKRKNNHLYISMRKYGVGAFKIEVIDETDDVAKLGELERKYIKECDSTNPDKGYNVTRGGERNQLDGNPRAKLTVEDVEKIRIIYSECKVGAKKCWEMYKDKISFDAFEKIYEGTTWKSIMPEVYTESNKYKHKHMDSKRMPGEKNGNAIVTNEQVYEMRKYYVNHTLNECYEKYGSNFKSKNTFRGMLTKAYKNIPIYSKIKHKWIFKNDIMKYTETEIVFEEIPDEITLAINISNCPCKCSACHSKYLWDDIGKELDPLELGTLIEKNSGITCVCFMGGDAEPSKINYYAWWVKNAFYGKIKVGWYSGRDEISDEIEIENFDYIKIGRYDDKFGPLNKKTTNQKMYKVNADKLEEITNKFWK